MTRFSFLSLILALPLAAQPKPDWKITVIPPANLKSDADLPFQVKITDAKGAPVGGAQVEFVLTMIDMDHGETKSRAKETKQAGVYAGKCNFMMSGGWNVEVRAKKGNASATQKFKYTVKD